MRNTNTVDHWSKVGIILALILLLFYFGGNILFPILFAAFISLALSSFASRMDGWGINRFISAFLLTGFISAVFVGVVIYLSYEGVRITDEISKLSGKKTLDTMVSLFEMVNRKLNVSATGMDDPISSFTGTVLSSSGKILSTLMKGFQSTVVFFSLVPIYIFFMLAYRPVFVRFLEEALGASKEQEGKDVVSQIIHMLKKYVGGLGIVILIVAVLNSIGLYVIGLDHAVFFGTSTALLMVIPYIGVIIGSIVPAAIAFITMDSYWYPVAILGMYVVVQFVEGNYITPAIVGTSLNLNPLAIIIGMVILGAVGGIVALIIAVPLIATIKIFLKHSKEFHSVAILFEQVPEEDKG